MPNSYFNLSSTSSTKNCEAKNLSLEVRQKIGVSALAGKESITQLSIEHLTSRKFIYAQKEKASEAIKGAFSENVKDTDILFYIPVTKQWLQQIVVFPIRSFVR